MIWLSSSTPLLEQEQFRHSVALAQIQQQSQQGIFQAQMQAGQAAVNVLQLFAGKSKAAALAAIAVNTALQIAQAIQNTATAQLRALSDLGPIAGPPAAAAIGTYGAVQVGLIVAAGALQGAGAIKGSPSIGGGGGGAIGGASPATSITPPADFGRSITIEMKPAELYSTAQVQLMIERINAEVKDGARLITTEIKPF